MPMVSPPTKTRVRRASKSLKRHNVCSTCYCMRDAPLGDGPASSRLVHQTKHFVCVVPFASRQYRVSIVPRAHRHSWLDIPVEELEDLAAALQLIMEAMFHHLDDPSYNIYVVSFDTEAVRSMAHLGDQAQEALHWSVEVHPRFPADLGGMEVASGIRVISGLPETWGQELRKAAEARLSLRTAPGATS